MNERESAANLLGRVVRLLVDSTKKTVVVSLSMETEGIRFTCPVQLNDEEDTTRPLTEGADLTETLMPVWNPQWQHLTDFEKTVIRALMAAGHEWTPSAKIAELTGWPRDHDFDAWLRYMVERNILGSSNGRGYRVKNPPAAPI